MRPIYRKALSISELPVRKARYSSRSAPNVNVNQGLGRFLHLCVAALQEGKEGGNVSNDVNFKDHFDNVYGRRTIRLGGG